MAVAMISHESAAKLHAALTVDGVSLSIDEAEVLGSLLVDLTKHLEIKNENEYEKPSPVRPSKKLS
jgi:hypothetical protein